MATLSGADLFLDDVERLHGELLGPLDARAGRGPQAELELAGVHRREDLRAELPADQPDQQARPPTR